MITPHPKKRKKLNFFWEKSYILIQIISKAIEGFGKLQAESISGEREKRENL